MAFLLLAGVPLLAGILAGFGLHEILGHGHTVRNEEKRGICEGCKRHGGSSLHHRTAPDENEQFATQAVANAVKAAADRGYDNAKFGFKFGSASEAIVERSAKADGKSGETPKLADSSLDGHLVMDMPTLEALFKRVVPRAESDEIDAGALDVNTGIADLGAIMGFENSRATGLWLDQTGDLAMPKADTNDKNCWRPNGTFQGINADGRQQDLGKWMVDYGSGCAGATGGAAIIGRSLGSIGGVPTTAGVDGWVWYG